MMMAIEDWLRAARAEEQRLLGELTKTDLFKQLEAVRGVLAVYQGKAAVQPLNTGAERGAKVLNVA
jgi:hypothetical protein